MNQTELELIAAREEAMKKVRIMWDIANLNGQIADPTKLPAWKEYLAAFAALDEYRSKGTRP